MYVGWEISSGAQPSSPGEMASVAKYVWPVVVVRHIAVVVREGDEAAYVEDELDVFDRCTVNQLVG